MKDKRRKYQYLVGSCKEEFLLYMQFVTFKKSRGEKDLKQIKKEALAQNHDLVVCCKINLDDGRDRQINFYKRKGNRFYGARE